uniref:Uncharacterized protein n=1 Tax=Arcella intermedia TaxID=1963864 RepID=A0A6B2LLH1_9EUKA
MQLQLHIKQADDKIKEHQANLHNLKAHQVEQEKLVEAEEEYITNTLFKRLEELQKEKNGLILEVEREEEYLTNTLQKKMEIVKQEKIALENRLEIEEEAIVIRLQKQLNILQEQKEELEQRVAETPRGTELRKLKWEVEIIKRTKEGEISKLESENFGLQQQINKYREQIETLQNEKKAGLLQ